MPMNFNELPLQEELLQGLRDLKFQHCTSIQEQALPLLLQGKDVAGQAQTGTGKTAAFLLSVMTVLLSRPSQPRSAGRPGAVVIAPTRELAIQIHRDAEAVGRHTNLRSVLVFGGVDYEKQRDSLRQNIDILIGTPGRLIDYLRQGVLDFRAVRTMVLDEADRMFDLGFIRDVRFLLRRMPEPTKRLNMLFTATLPWKVIELAHEHMNEPEIIRINPGRIAVDGIDQKLYHTSNEEKISLLIGLLRSINPSRAIIFVNTRRGADRVQAYLQGNGLSAAILTGDIPQQKRMRLLHSFSEGEMPILVATDLAARGLHIPEISHIFNYDLPQQAEDYVHRIGRTARAGASGTAISLACESYVYSLPEIEKYLGHKLPVDSVQHEWLVKPQPPHRRAGAKAARSSQGGRRTGQGRRPRQRAHESAPTPPAASR